MMSIIKNFIRTFRRHKLYTFINLFGLALGIGCSLCILLFVADELSYDRHFAEPDKLFRVIQTDEEEGEGSSLPFPVTTTLQHDYPDFIEKQVRLFNYQASTLAINYESAEGIKAFNEPHFFFGDSTFFEVFGLPLISGNPHEVLKGPGKVVVTESTARRYFGEDDAVGKILKFEGKYDLTITGVMKDVPSNTHFSLDFVASFHSLNELFPNGIPENNWYWNPVWAYVRLRDAADQDELQRQLPFFAEKYYHPSLKGKVGLKLQPVHEIYLHSKAEYEIKSMSDIRYVYVFSLIGFSILIIAAINFINLTTALASYRYKEIGVKKILGAEKKSLLSQFLGESFLIVILSALVAVVLAVIAMPLLNQLTGKSLPIGLLWRWQVVMVYLGIIVFIAVASGLYPAILLSSQRIITVLKADATPGGGRTWLRKSLVIFQFVLAIVFISGTLVIYRQIEFMRTKELGFDSDKIIMLPVQRLSVVPKYETFKDRLLANRNILNVSSVNTIIGKDFQSSNYKKEGESDDALSLRPCLFVRSDFAKTLGVKVIAGSDFLPEVTAPGNYAIINKALAEAWGWHNPEDALNQTLNGTMEGKITIQGVVEDFHFAPLKDAIGPMIAIRSDLTKWADFFTRFVMVRIQGDNLPQTLDFLKTEWEGMVPESPFEYFFLDDRLQQTYESEVRLNNITTTFSVIAIFISMLGLFGLASFSIQKRTKEVSIRKVLGASASSLLTLLSVDFLKLIVGAAVIAVPISIYFLNNWLNAFAYRIDLEVQYFIISIASLTIVAFLTILYVIIKATRVNPAATLRTE